MQKADKWQLQSTVTPSSIEQVVELLLANRQIEDEQAFFQPASPAEISLVEAGFEEAGLPELLVRLEEAKAKQEQILIFGDYDADGICATAILWQSLHSLGYQATPFIPNRA
jgi:single-stranded-DNA-specific exonuclease